METPEGALTIRSVAGKAIAVFTREPAGRVRFRMMLNVRRSGEQQPVVKITLENGRSFRAGLDQVLFKKGMVECRADALTVSDELEAAFCFPEGYRYREDAGGERESAASLRVTAIEPGGTADVYALGVNQTGCFFLTAGVLCRAEDAPAEPAGTITATAS